MFMTITSSVLLIVLDFVYDDHVRERNLPLGSLCLRWLQFISNPHQAPKERELPWLTYGGGHVEV